MKVLLVKPGKVPVVTDIVHDLPAMQEIVGGQIEASYPDSLPGVVMVGNEDGKYLRLPLNRYFIHGGMPDIMCGTFFICGTDYNACEFCSLTDEQIDACLKRFQLPEMFFNVCGTLVVVNSDKEVSDDE